MLREILFTCCIGLLAAAVPTGCADPPESRGSATTSPRTKQSTQTETRTDASQIVALVNGAPITLAALRRPLMERAGEEILREAALDHLLRERIRSLGLRVEEADLKYEEQRLVKQFGGDESEAGDLLSAIRQRRGLGETRYQLLLWRNAALRKLVTQEREPVAESAIRNAYQQAYGDLHEMRLITASTLREATAARRRLDAGETFAEVAADVSTDISRHRGGLLEPLSLADPTYPQIIRDAARNLSVGQVSVPLALESGYALVRLERIIQRDKPPLEQVRPDLERSVRLLQERLLMDELARSLLGDARVTVFERGVRLDESAR